MMLAISSGCIFTGCIDNDEPYGIEQIRVATASLLEAKKNAVAAEAAAANANLEIEKIKAEIAKLEIENAKIIAESQAKINEAQAEAELLKAKAEAAVNDALAAQYNAQAEEALARANDQKAKTEAYIKDQEATLNEKIALAETNVKTAELEYERSLYGFEQDKAKNLGCAEKTLWQAVSDAFGSYLAELDAYNQANRKYLKAVQELAKQNTNITWDGNKFTSLAWDQKASIEKEIARINNDLAVENNNVAEVEEFNKKLADVKEADPKGLYTLLADYEDKLTDATAAKTEAEAALLSLKLDNKDIIEAPEKIQAEIEELRKATITVPAWDYTVVPQLKVLGGGWDTDKVIIPETTFEQQDKNKYDDLVREYQTNIRNISKAFLDPNDQLWTAARVKELARAIPPVAQQVTKAWSNAKTVYNNGDAAKSIEAPNGANVKSTADAFNAASTSLLDLNKKYYAAMQADDDAIVAYNEALGKYNVAASNEYQTAYETYENNRQTIDEAYNAAELAAREARDKADEAIPGKIAAAQPKVDAANVAYQNALVAAEGNEKDPNVVKAKSEYDAELAKLNAIYGEYSTNWDVYEKAVDAATKKQREDSEANYKAWDAAQQKFNKAYDADVMNADPIVKPSYTAMLAADKALEAAEKAFVEQREATNKAFNAFNDAVNEQVAGINKLYAGEWAFYYAVDANANDSRNVANALYNLGSRPAAEDASAPQVIIPFDYQKNGVYVNAKQYVISASEYTFGQLGYAYDNKYNSSTIDWDQDMAILLNIDFDKPLENMDKIFEVFDGYLKDEDLVDGEENITPWNYHYQYYRFGAYGEQVLQDMYQYSVGTICVENDFNDIINQLLEQPKADLATLQSDYEAATKAVDDKQVEYNDAVKAANDLTTAAEANLTAAQETWNTINSLVYTLKGGIAQLEALAVGAMPTYDAAQIVEGMIQENNEKLAAAQKLIEELNAQLEEINYIKGQYEGENGYASLVNPYTYQVEYLKTKVENAKELMEFAKARYEALQAKYDAANK